MLSMSEVLFQALAVCLITFSPSQQLFKLYISHFTGENTEAQKGQVICLRSLSK